MLTIKAMAGGDNYAAHHLRNNDYYSVGETITGHWMGRGAELLKLQGAVTMDQFDAIRQGIDPSTGEFLRQRHGADRFNEEGKRTATARNLYDFTVSAPKAVSVQALEDPRLVVAHKNAVAEMSAEMESLAGARIRKDGAQDTRTTSNLVIARYDHDSSRELDPQLHSHLVAGNLTFDGAEGRWKALATYDIYQQREYLTEVYRNALAREVTTLGYQIEDHMKHGKDNGFGIAGIKEATLEKYSQRSAQRDQAIGEFLKENGRLPSNNEIARLVRDTRPEKLTAITTAEVKASQYARMDPEEARTLKQLHQTALAGGSVREASVAAPSLAYAREHVFERVSVAKEYEVQTEALRHGRGRVELPELKAELLAEVANGEMLRAHREVATKEGLLREQRMVATINEGRGAYQALGRGREFIPSQRLNVEQKAAIHAVLESRDLAINLQGAAGTGKTATLQEMRRGLHDARRSVVTVAPTASAVEELQKVGFPQAMTISRLLADPKQQHELKDQVLIIDEAGMVSSKDMSDLLRLAKTHDARVVFSGDTAQIKSVSEGDALRVLERESKLKSVSLVNVQRQKANAEYLAAVETLRVRPSDGFTKLEEMSAIREVDWRLRGREVSNAYREALAVANVKGEAREVLVITATHNEIKSITHAIRTDRKAAGELAQGELLTNHSALNWTEAQRKQLHKYQPGQVLEFHKAVKGVGKNEALEVVSANKSGITARKENGKAVRLTTKQTKAFGVFEKQDIEVSAGDKLLLKANWHGKDFKATNGELVTVAGVEEGRIRLEDGRQLPAEYRQFSHGYAVTAHRSQGKTVDFEIIAAERMAQDLFYVSATRAREGLTVITSDKTTLMESIGVSGDRQSASELAKNAAKQAPAMAFDEHDLFRVYEAHQQQRQAPQQSIKQQEIAHTPHVHHHSTGLGIGF
jgi:conjugative relaxase-like TrwC/TraI family protein